MDTKILAGSEVGTFPPVILLGFGAFSRMGDGPCVRASAHSRPSRSAKRLGATVRAGVSWMVSCGKSFPPAALGSRKKNWI